MVSISFGLITNKEQRNEIYTYIKKDIFQTFYQLHIYVDCINICFTFIFGLHRQDRLRDDRKQDSPVGPRLGVEPRSKTKPLGRLLCQLR